MSDPRDYPDKRAYNLPLIRDSINDAVGRGYDSVIVVTNSKCPVCSRHNRRVYSISGRSGEYPALPPELRGSGGFCPNCVVTVAPYGEGMDVSAMQEVDPMEYVPPRQDPQPAQYLAQHVEEPPQPEWDHAYYQYAVEEVKGGFLLGSARPWKIQEIMNRYSEEAWEVVDVECYVRTLLIFFGRWSAIITFRRRYA